MITLRIVARLLDYPDEALFTHHAEMLAALEAGSELDAAQRAQLTDFITEFCAGSLLDRQADYCELFDRGRATSLLLFEHVHGESRDRGQAMVDLLEQYRADGLELSAKELPDFLPLYLEYLASLDVTRARAGLADVAPILALLAARLKQRQSRYSELFTVLLALSGAGLAVDDLTPKIHKEARDDTPAALDAVWEEEQIKFLGEQGCASAQQAAHQRRFADAVAPQYLDVAAMTTSTGRSS